MALTAFTTDLLSVLKDGAFRYAEGTVTAVLASVALPGACTMTRTVAFGVTAYTLAAPRDVMEKSKRRVTLLHTPRLPADVEVQALQAEVAPLAPAPVWGALGAADLALTDTFLWIFVVLQEGAVVGRLHDLAPAYFACVAQACILQDGNGAGADLTK